MKCISEILIYNGMHLIPPKSAKALQEILLSFVLALRVPAHWGTQACPGILHGTVDDTKYLLTNLALIRDK